MLVRYVNEQDGHRCTPLHAAVSADAGVAPGFSSIDAVIELLVLGADPTIANDNGDTPLGVILNTARGVRVRWDDNDYLAIRRWLAVALRLAADTAWWRRRHLLLTIRGRRRDPVGAPTAAGAAADDSCDDGTAAPMA